MGVDTDIEQMLSIWQILYHANIPSPDIAHEQCAWDKAAIDDAVTILMAPTCISLIHVYAALSAIREERIAYPANQALVAYHVMPRSTIWSGGNFPAQIFHRPRSPKD